MERAAPRPAGSGAVMWEASELLLATHMLAFEGDSQVRFFEGNFQAYEADRHERLGSDADQPHRLRYKKLVHS